jgi:hypothetical protein
MENVWTAVLTLEKDFEIMAERMSRNMPIAESTRQVLHDVAPGFTLPTGETRRQEI